MSCSLGGDIADALLIGFMNAFDTNRVHSIIKYQLLVLDDDDHNLANSTPNFASIEFGFEQHGFPAFQLPPDSRICP